MATSTTHPAIHAGRRGERDVGADAAIGLAEDAGATIGLAERAGGSAPAVAAAARTFPPGGDFFLRLIRPSSGFVWRAFAAQQRAILPPNGG